MLFTSRTNKLSYNRLRSISAIGLAGAALAIGFGAQAASAAPSLPFGMPAKAAAMGARPLGWSADVEATCMFSRSYFVTTGSRIDVRLPDSMKAADFYLRPWMRIQNGYGGRWVTQGWQHRTPSTDTGYPINVSWNVTGRNTDFYPAVEVYFPAGSPYNTSGRAIDTFSLAVTATAGLVRPGMPMPCHMGG